MIEASLIMNSRPVFVEQVSILRPDSDEAAHSLSSVLLG